MPSAVSNLHEHDLIVLKDLIQQEYGNAISSKSDCDTLAELIEIRTRKRISVNTLRRFFEVMPTAHRPSLETLNIIAAFCGYSDFFEFKRSLGQTEKAKNADLTLDAVNDLFGALGETPRFYTNLSWLTTLAFRDRNISFLKRFFDLDVFTGKVDYTLVGFIKPLMNFGLELQANPKLFDLLVKPYAHNPVAQTFYFECFVDYDFLTIRHHHAIRAYSQLKKDREAQLFSLCILFLYSFLLNDRMACADLIKRINAIDFSPALHPFPVGRKMACNILFQSFYVGSVDQALIKQIFDLEKRMPRAGALGRNTPSYHIVVAEALAWAGLHHEAAAIIEIALKTYPIELNYHNEGIWSKLWITYADVLFKLHRVEESRAVYRNIDPAHFSTSNKKFYLMHYHKIGSEIQKQDDPKLALSLKRSSLDIATHHRFTVFHTLYS